MTSVTKKTLTVLIYCFGVIAVVSMFAYAFLENIYLEYPRSPDEALGRSVSHHVKSIVVYLTQGESTTIHIVVTVLIVSGALTLIGIFIHQRWPLRGDR